MYRTVPLYETDNGPKILESEFNGVLLGMVADPNIAGPTSFSDYVSHCSGEKKIRHSMIETFVSFTDKKQNIRQFQSKEFGNGHTFE